MIRYSAHALRPKHFDPPPVEPEPDAPLRKNQQSIHGKSADALYRILCAVAAKGDLCPSTEELMERLGRAQSLIPELFRKLQRDGRISVMRVKRRRIVLITKTGQRTADPREIRHA